jgi:hypothetical protein
MIRFGLGVTITFRACWLSLIMAWLVAAAVSGSSVRADDVILYGTTGAGVGVGQGPGRILTIDYTAGTILNAFDGPSGGFVGNGFSGAGFRRSTGELYVSDSSGPPDPTNVGTAHVYAINPTTGAVDKSFGYGPSFNFGYDGLEFIGDRLFLSSSAFGQITEFNPDTGAFIDFQTIGIIGTGRALASIGPNFYLSYTNNNGNNMIAAFSQNDGLNYGQLLFQYSTPGHLLVNGLAGSGGDLYAAAADGAIYRLNPTTGNVLDSRTLSDPIFGSGIVLDSLAEAGSPVPLPSAAWGGGVLLIVLALVNRRGIARLVIPGT